MRDNLPFKIHQIENGIVNLDSFQGKGTHWVCYRKINDNIYYFDSYGNLRPPPELIEYFKSSSDNVNIYYNYTGKQKINSINCGHLCLAFLTGNI